MDEYEQKVALDDKLGYDTQAQKALWKGYQIYLSFIEDKDPAIRECVLSLLGSFRGEIATVLPVFLSRLQIETDTRLKATLVWLLYGLLPRKHPESKEYLRPYLDPNQPLLIRFETARAFAEIEREALSQEIWDILAFVFQDPSNLDAKFRKDSHPGLGVAAYIAGMFPYVGRERSKPLLPFLWGYLQTAGSSYTSQYLTRAALFLAFDSPPAPPPTELNEEQITTLKIIMENGVPSKYGGWNGTVLGELRQYGFPNQLELLQSYLAGADKQSGETVF